MKGDHNSPAEVSRRLAYLLYVVAFLTYILSSVILLARPGVGEAVFTGGALLFLAAIRQVGYRWLDFARLNESFPCGCALDRVSEKTRAEVEALVAEFSAANTDWTRRVEIRHRLIELEELEPEIIHAYESDLKRVLAA